MSREHIDNDSAEACQRLVDRCFVKFVRNGCPGSEIPSNAARLRLSAQDRARLSAAGKVSWPGALPVKISTIIAKIPVKSEWRRAGKRWGVVSKAARDYLSAPRYHGDLAKFAEKYGVEYVKLLAAVKREQKLAMRRKAA